MDFRKRASESLKKVVLIPITIANSFITKFDTWISSFWSFSDSHVEFCYRDFYTKVHLQEKHFWLRYYENVDWTHVEKLWETGYVYGLVGTTLPPPSIMNMIERLSIHEQSNHLHIESETLKILMIECEPSSVTLNCPQLETVRTKSSYGIPIKDYFTINCKHSTLGDLKSLIEEGYSAAILGPELGTDIIQKMIELPDSDIRLTFHLGCNPIAIATAIVMSSRYDVYIRKICECDTISQELVEEKVKVISDHLSSHGCTYYTQQTKVDKTRRDCLLFKFRRNDILKQTDLLSMLYII